MAIGPGIGSTQLNRKKKAFFHIDGWDAAGSFEF